MQFIVIRQREYGGGFGVEWYDTLAEAQAEAVAGDTIAIEIIGEVK